jgi:anti-anti-sigma factor
VSGGPGAAKGEKDKNAVAPDKHYSLTPKKSFDPKSTPMAAFQTTTEGSINILAVSGRLDPNGGKDLKDTMTVLTDGEAPGDLVVDLASLDYMASAGFRELFLAGRKIGRSGGRLVVCGLRGEVKRVFELARFDTAYPIFATREEALAFLQGPKADA